MILDPQSMGLDTLIVELCALLAEIWQNLHFPVMASLICIKMICGTFYQLFNIANRVLWHFSNLETSIRNWFPGGARYPLLPTRLKSPPGCINSCPLLVWESDDRGGGGGGYPTPPIVCATRGRRHQQCCASTQPSFRRANCMFGLLTDC